MTIYKRLIIFNKLIKFFSIFDKKTQLIYINILYNTKYKVLFLSKKIINFPLFFSLYLFSKEKNILNTLYKILNYKLYLFYTTYKLSIEFRGIGYKFLFINKNLYFILGYSHLIKLKLPKTCSIYIDEKNKLLILIYSNKYMLGNIFYIIKSCKKLNVYKGKGIKNIFDQIKLKLSKTKNIKK
uniref:Ribosomal protein L6 n=1 Tax=Cyclospora cayetanensis TaxID=88456 RepID=A0A0K0NU21_9EIME|nr:ribosomal protein L6 [Cyclospora cayetanensis]AKO71986.1 ribosomal protein L6 [Cyclospora cayetanensis]ANJ44337.1 ribosomal protein L6 [Cyclospora cayetanensis]ANN13271.1 ribosomal protein L6 [Cyclospora cayetanensis]ANN13300.1 ribosomal protein L6 [Cyclospora cayetanensis]ANN13329.1 ribosomal protein L6 [Cyclospora cayetanensis]